MVVVAAPAKGVTVEVDFGPVGVAVVIVALPYDPLPGATGVADDVSVVLVIVAVVPVGGAEQVADDDAVAVPVADEEELVYAPRLICWMFAQAMRVLFGKWKTMERPKTEALLVGSVETNRS